MTCSAHRLPAVRPPPGPCAHGTHGGLASRALAWGSHGWASLTTSHGRVILREYAPDGDAREGSVDIVGESSPDPRLAIGWADNAWLVVVASRGGEARVVRAEAGAAPVVHALSDRVTGDAAVVVVAGGAAIFYDTPDGPRMVDVHGSPSSSETCPSDLSPRSVISMGDGFMALAPVVDRATGDGVGLDVVTLDRRCHESTRLHLWNGALNGRVHALASDGIGRVYAAFSDRDEAAWLAVVANDGSVLVRPRRLMPGARSPQVLADEAGATLIVVRMDEAADTLVATRVDTDGILQRSQTQASAPSMELLAVAPDPWGGALVGWTRPDPTGGASRTGTGVYSLVTRVCPAGR